MDGTIRTNAYTVDRAAYLRTMFTYKLPVRLGIVAGILVLVAGALAATGQIAFGLGVLIGTGVYLPLLLVLRYVLSRRNVYGPATRNAFDDRRTAEFSEAGMAVQTQSGVNSTVPWGYFVKVVRRGGFTLLFAGPVVHVIVPDAAFASDADRRAFAHLVEERVATPGRKGK